MKKIILAISVLLSLSLKSQSVLAPKQGGTGVNNGAKTITIGSSINIPVNASGALTNNGSGVFTWTTGGGGVTAVGSYFAAQIPFFAGTNKITGTNKFKYDSAGVRINMNDGTTPLFNTSAIEITKTVNAGAVEIGITNLGTGNSVSDLYLAESSTSYGIISRYNFTNTGNLFAGIAIPRSGLMHVNNHGYGLSGRGDLALQGQKVYGLTGGITPANTGFLLDSIGFRIDAQSTFTAANTFDFAVRTGITYKESTKDFKLLSSANSTAIITVNNTNAGAGTNSYFEARNDLGNQGLMQFGSTSSGYTPYGALGANMGFGYGSSANGFVFMADHATGKIIFTTGGNVEKMRLSANGNLGIGNTATYKLDVATGDIGIATAGNTLRIKSGANGRINTAVLVAGTLPITINGLTTASMAYVTLTVPGGTLGAGYKAVCTANTLTITSVTSAGATQTLDTSTLNYVIFENY